MMIQGLYNSLGGMQRAEEALAQTASNISRTSVTDNRSVDEIYNEVNDKVELSSRKERQSDIARDMTDMIVEKRAFQYNSAAVRTEDQMLGTLINITG